MPASGNLHLSTELSDQDLTRHRARPSNPRYVEPFGQSLTWLAGSCSIVGHRCIRYRTCYQLIAVLVISDSQRVRPRMAVVTLTGEAPFVAVDRRGAVNTRDTSDPRGLRM